MKKAFIKNTNAGTFLHFFNSKEVYAIELFDTERKARNYGKKYGYELVSELPSGIQPFENCN